MARNILAIAFAQAVWSVRAIQYTQHTHRQARSKVYGATERMKVIYLDENETAERGSYCLNGAIPAYYFKKGTKLDKWILAFQGGEWCQNLNDCVHKTTTTFLHAEKDDSKNDLSVFKTPEFKDYNHVVFHHCDAGLSMGDRDHPIIHKGVKLFFRGRRIIDHVLDDLKNKTTFSSAEEVMITGGSGGGQATFIAADYLASQMPKSVVKLGGVPMSGWYPMSAPSQKEGFLLHNMTAAIVPRCRKKFPANEQWKCIHSDVAYQYSTTPMFVVQLLDYHGISALGKRTLSAWHKCLFNNQSSCGATGIENLEGYLESVVLGLNASNKFFQKSEGGFVSSCTKHTFYSKDEYRHYARDGVTIEQAVTRWWDNLGSEKREKKGKWYLPCKLHKSYPHQCEHSCDYGTNGEDQHAGDGVE